MKFGYVIGLCEFHHSTLQENKEFNEYWHNRCREHWLKNYGSLEEFIRVGSSAGTITNMTYDKDLLKELFNKTAINLNLLSYFSNITLAPHQRYLFPIQTRDVENKKLLFEISYNSSTKSYKEVFDINLSQDYAITYKKQNKSDVDKEIFTISNALQELVRRK